MHFSPSEWRNGNIKESSKKYRKSTTGELINKSHFNSSYMYVALAPKDIFHYHVKNKTKSKGMKNSRDR